MRIGALQFSWHQGHQLEHSDECLGQRSLSSGFPGSNARSDVDWCGFRSVRLDVRPLWHGPEIGYPQIDCGLNRLRSDLAWLISAFPSLCKILESTREPQ